MLLLVPSILLISTVLSQDIPEYGPISANFDAWLDRNGYGKYDYARLDLGTAGSFGGMSSDMEYFDTSKDPVIFFHGNSDAALTANNFSTGWTTTVQYFLNQGYTLGHLYGTSWGNTNTTAAVERDHDCVTVFRLRKFVEAVMDYTGAKQINIISHSMGVTLARKVILGGYINADDGSCNIGKPLGNKVRVILGIAGANFGLCACVGHWLGVTWPTCNDDNGLWPGETCYPNPMNGQCAASPLPSPCNGLTYSKFLMDLNNSRFKPAQHIFSMWSMEDELIDLRRMSRKFGDDLIGDGNMVWGRPTSEIPFSDSNKIYKNYTHMETKLNTAADQFHIITQLTIP
ncbi:Lipase [Caenorhabditis elegans]|uniref:Lipase n=2 Tax=Caenorhabditis elegans TaxID=6239 RepID=H9G2X1_CAEEL|nr:Lipase [Caenorhabditis elegans]CCG28184.1 Lipase [Caenorhabditis elegans]|eukprot:NP_001255589.1 LIPaSe related [Caenorhabditis elegans]